MDIYKCIKTRRSVRSYTAERVSDEVIDKILHSAIWTPSGKNGQPWKFKIVEDKNTINKLSDLSIYGSWMKKASHLILVFLDKKCSYNYLKDVQSCGAAMQNIMLTAHSLGIGSCWIGEILSRADVVKNILEIENDNIELMGIITLGYERGKSINPGRKEYESFFI